MRNYLHPIVVFTKMNILRFFRDKVYMFFMFILPVAFLMLFGMMYSGNNFSSFNVAFFNKSDSPVAQSFVEIATADDSLFETIETDDYADAEDRMIRGEISAIIVIPEDFGAPVEVVCDPASTVPCEANPLPGGEVSVLYSKNAEQSGQAISSIVGSFVDEMNAQITGQRPVITVKAEALTREGLTNFDYVFAGLLGYTILTIGLMGISNVLPGDKESGATKRLRATTIKPSQFIISYALTFLLVGIISFILMVGIGTVVFDFEMRGNWLVFGPFVCLSTVMMMGFGLFVGGWARTEAQASALGNILMFPMMFLSGVFFPMFMMPEFIQTISHFMPLTPVVDGIRLIITENYGLVELMPQIGLIAVWAFVIYFIAVRAFRWE